MPITVQLIFSALMLGSVLLAGRRHIAAWPTLIIGQSLFLAYAIPAGQAGLWPWNAGMIIVAGLNWRDWARQRHAV
jgi:hypothetical protein